MTKFELPIIIAQHAASVDLLESDEGFVAFLKAEHSALLAHMLGSLSLYYRLILANRLSQEQLEVIAEELPVSLPVQALLGYRSSGRFQ